MDAARWRRIDELFHEAVELAPEARAELLARLSTTDAELAVEVGQLLAAHREAELDSAALARWAAPAEDADSPPVAGRRFGPYEAIEEIGRGGMGSVLLARRVDGQFEQRVAIKQIKRGMDSAQILGRFRVERQILASLEHPRIARLLDGGTTDDGLPYFVMEHIEGQPIDAFADERRLTIRQRLELFLEVCDAVSFAHQRLIVHRDLKPQNILVTKEGVPKLLDFGIAKVLDEGVESGTHTVAWARALTPDYASPEQIEGRPTTTQSDVYSLGVVLYELLTGRSPYRPTTWSAPDVCESVRTAAIERPSTAVARAPGEPATRPRAAGREDRAAATAAGSLDRLRTQLAGDLDAIVLTALHKDPARRYASVEQLASDIRRHLDGLPVRARTDSLGYRAAKFAGRHRAAVTVAALGSLLLFGSALVAAREAAKARHQARIAQEAQRSAERRFAEVRKLANDLLFDYHDAIKDLPGSTPVRERLVRDALDYLKRLSEEAGDDASLRMELALAYRKVAEVQGSNTKASLGDTEGALRSLETSRALLEELVAREPRDESEARATRRVLVEVSADLTELLLETGDTGRALTLARSAVGDAEALNAGAPPDLEFRDTLARTYDALGAIQLESGNVADALATHLRQIALLESAPEAERRDPRLRRALSSAYQHVADAQFAGGDLAGALASHRQSLAQREALSAEVPINTDYRRLVATSHFYVADTLARLGRTKDALEEFLKSTAIGEELSAADPKAYGAGPAFGLVQVGAMQMKLGDPGAAIPNFRRAWTIQRDEVAADPASLWKRVSLVDFEARLCDALASIGSGEAKSICPGAVERIGATQVERSSAALRTYLAVAYSILGDAYAKLGERDRAAAPDERAATRTAREMYRRSLEIWNELASDSVLAADDAEKPAAVRRSLERVEAALRG